MAPNFRTAVSRYSFALAAFSTCSIAGTLPAASEPGAAELGVWINHTGRGAVELYKCGGSVCGRIVWVRDPTNAAGKPRTDINNPDPGRRGRAICGLVTFSGLKRTASGWGDGQGYNPEDGTSFNVSIQLSGANALKVTGSKLIFSKTVYWKRPTSEVQRCDRPAVPATPPPQIAAPKPAAPVVPAKATVAVEASEAVPAPAPSAVTAPQEMPAPPERAAAPPASPPAPIKSAATSPAAETAATPAKAVPVTTTVAPVAPIVKPAPPQPMPAKQPAKSAVVTPPSQPVAKPVAPKPEVVRASPANPAVAKPSAPASATAKAAPATAPGKPKPVSAAATNAATPPPNGGWPITGAGQKPGSDPAASAAPAAAPAAQPAIAPVAKKPPRKKPEIFDGTTIPMTVLR